MTTFFWPIAIFFAALYVAGENRLAGLDLKMLERSVYVLAIFTVFGAYRFKLSAFALVALMVALGGYLTHNIFPAGDESAPDRFLFAAWLILFPLNLILINLWGGDKPGEGRGGLKALLIAAQAAFIWYLWDGLNGSFPSAFQNGIREMVAGLLFWQPFGSVTGIPQQAPQLAAITFAIAFLLILGRQFFRSANVAAGSIGILLSVAVASAFETGIVGTGLLYTAAAIIVFVSLVGEIYRLAFTDDLTGIPSRRAFNVELRKQKRAFAVAMVDVDHFKRVNDKYGHDVGDQALRMVARHLQTVAGGGKYFRYGGEEFAILFPGREAVESAHFVEAVRESLAAHRLGIRAKDRPKRLSENQAEQRRTKRAKGILGITITFSAGVAARKDKKQTQHSVVAAADKALYQAKNKGRNRTVAV